MEGAEETIREGVMWVLIGQETKTNESRLSGRDEVKCAHAGVWQTGLGELQVGVHVDSITIKD